MTTIVHNDIIKTRFRYRRNLRGCNDKKMEFRRRLKHLRKEAGLTQRELAKKSGISYSYITKLESDNAKNPTYETLERISMALNVPLHLLLHE